MRGLSLVAASGGRSSSRCAGLSPSRPLLLRSTGSRRAGSVIVAHGPSCSVACGIFPDQGSNPCRLHWQADSQPLRHQGSSETCSKWIRQNVPFLLRWEEGLVWKWAEVWLLGGSGLTAQCLEAPVGLLLQDRGRHTFNCKGSDGKYVRFHGPFGLCHSYFNFAVVV